MSFFSCVDAYFLYKRQKIYISNLNDDVEAIINVKCIVEYNLDYLLLFFVDKKPDYALAYDYDSENFKDKLQIIIPKCWFTTDPIYNIDTATTRGADNELYKLLAIGQEIVATSYPSKRSLTLAGGVAVTFIEYTIFGPKYFFKKSNDGKPYDFLEAEIDDPTFFDGLQLYHDKTLEYVEINIKTSAFNYYEKFFLAGVDGVSQIIFKVPANITATPSLSTVVLTLPEKKLYFAQTLKKVLCGNNMSLVDHNYKFTRKNTLINERVHCLSFRDLEKEIVGVTRGYFSDKRKKIIHYKKCIYVPTFNLSFSHMKILSKFEKIYIRYEDSQVETTECIIYLNDIIGFSIFFKEDNFLDNIIEFYDEKIINNRDLPWFEKTQNLILYSSGIRSELIIKDFDFDNEFDDELKSILDSSVLLTNNFTYRNITFIRIKNGYNEPNITLVLNDRNNYENRIEKIYTNTLSNYSRAITFEDEPFINTIKFFYDSFDFEAYYDIEIASDVCLIFKIETWTIQDNGLFCSETLSFPADYFKSFGYFTCKTYFPFCGLLYCDIIGNYRNETPIVQIANKNNVASVIYKLNALPYFKFYSTIECPIIVMNLIR